MRTGTVRPAVRRWNDEWVMTVEGLTVRRALDEVGLNAPARFYPEWACAEAFLLVLLRIGVRLPAATAYRRAGEVGLRRVSVEGAANRLGVIATNQPQLRRVAQTWSLPADLMTDAGLLVVERRWRSAGFGMQETGLELEVRG